jgi:hypothetical protein
MNSAISSAILMRQSPLIQFEFCKSSATVNFFLQASLYSRGATFLGAMPSSQADSQNFTFLPLPSNTVVEDLDS